MEDTPENRQIAWQASQLVTEFRMNRKRKGDWQWLYDQIVALGVAAAEATRMGQAELDQSKILEENHHLAITQPELLTLVERLQNFFSIPQQVCVPRDAMRDLFAAVALCLRHTTMPEGGLRYIRGNLGFGQGTTPVMVAEEVEHHLQLLDEDCTSHLRIDTALRCIGVPLRDYPSTLTGRDIQQMVRWLAPIVAIEGGK